MQIKTLINENYVLSVKTCLYVWVSIGRLGFVGVKINDLSYEKKLNSVCYAYYYSWLIFMAYIKQQDLIYSLKQDCECKMIQLTENVIFFCMKLGT